MSDSPNQSPQRSEEQPSAAAALRDEIERTRLAQNDRSALRVAIDAVTSPYHRQGEAIQRLTALANDTGASEQQINEAIRQNRAAQQREQDANSIGSGTLKTLGMFAAGRFGFATTVGTFISDEVRPQAPTMTDGTLGFMKGASERFVARRLLESSAGPAIATFGMGMSGRFFDTTLSRNTYTGEGGAFSLSAGVANIAARTLDPHALAVDGMTAGVTYGVLRATGGALSANSFRTVATTGFTTGYAGGMVEELSRQHRSGDYDASRLVAFPIARAVSSAVASLPGAQRQYVREYPWLQAERTRNSEFQLVSVAAADVRRVAAAEGKPVDITVRPVGEGAVAGAEQTVSVQRQSVPVDWISSLANRFVGRAPRISDAPDQLRFLSRSNAAPGEQPGPWSMVTRPAPRSLSEIAGSDQFYIHHTYAREALQRFAEPTQRFLSSGSESGAFLMSNGAVFKFTKLKEQDDVHTWGNAPGDARLLTPPMQLHTRTDNFGTHNFVGYLQEYVRPGASPTQIHRQTETLEAHGYSFWDRNASDQMGVNGAGQPVVIDYGARVLKGKEPPSMLNS